jgi:hypothetical protein
MKDILTFIQQNGKVEKAVLLNEFKSVATPNTLAELISGLLAMKKVSASVLPGGKIMYESN